MDFSKNIDFPPWYDSGRYYDLVQSFNLFDFYWNLNLRYLISGSLFSAGRYSSNIKSIDKKAIQDNVDSKIMSQWLNHTLERVPSDLMRKYYHELANEKVTDNLHLRKDVKRDKLFSKSISPLNWRKIKKIDLDFQQLSKNHLSEKEKSLLNLHLKNHISRFEVETDTDSFLESTKPYKEEKIFDVMYEPICTIWAGEDSHNVQINIDMRTPNSVLIKEFENLLKNLRKIEGLDFDKGKKSKPITFGRWIEFKLFEYFDLSLWFAYTDQKITDYQMGCILFPDEYEKDVTAIIRGSTRRYLDYILTDEYNQKLYWEVWVLLDEFK
ncbi:DUF6387 family protein [Marinicella meishanensis]|uniref:DUF6387 family protein n=1 Tax=Marinicella meishanensis TaxID=2873263 RepID=UPI001CC015E0|nr:DUF6387 family protein [Marinicella sp. NBU2979]